MHFSYCRNNMKKKQTEQGFRRSERHSSPIPCVYTPPSASAAYQRYHFVKCEGVAPMNTG